MGINTWTESRRARSYELLAREMRMMTTAAAAAATAAAAYGFVALHLWA